MSTINYFRKTGFYICLSLLCMLGFAVFLSSFSLYPLHAPASRRTVVTAAGATFPLPYYNEIFKAWWERNNQPVTYAGIGSERGLKSLKNRQIDFAGIDVVPTSEELAAMPAETILLPTCMGAVVLAYNLPGVQELRLTGDLVADIYLGRIVKWNDARIGAVNPGTQLPDKEIYPVFRMDGSGTTYIFSDYLSRVSSGWKSGVGTGKLLNFPRGVAASGNPGVAGLVEKITGAIGYVGSEYSFAYGLPAASLENASGRFITPSPASITAAASTADVSQPMITDSPAADAYPVSTFSWVLLYREQSYDGRTREEAEATAKVLRWLVGPEAQAMTTAVQFSPLPGKAAEYARKQLETLTYEGKPLK